MCWRWLCWHRSMCWSWWWAAVRCNWIWLELSVLVLVVEVFHPSFPESPINGLGSKPQFVPITRIQNRNFLHKQSRRESQSQSQKYCDSRSRSVTFLLYILLNNRCLYMYSYFYVFFASSAPLPLTSFRISNHSCSIQVIWWRAWQTDLTFVVVNQSDTPNKLDFTLE